MDVKDIAQIDAARRQFDEISAKARIAVFRKVLEHYQRHPGSPWSGAPLVDLERTIKAFYADLGAEYKTVFRETLPPLMKQYYDRALAEIKKAGVRNAILGKPDAGRVKYFLESAFDQVAMKTQNMTVNHIRELRRIAADVTRQMSVTGATRREVSKAMLDRAMTIPGFQFIDKAGNRWPLKSYFDTLARTELMNAARASYDDKVAKEGFDVMRLTTSGNCCEACARFEGELFSLTGATPGLPTKQDLLDAGVFHPNCTHSYSLVPDYIAEKYYNPDGSRKDRPQKTGTAPFLFGSGKADHFSKKFTGEFTEQGKAFDKALKEAGAPPEIRDELNWNHTPEMQRLCGQNPNVKFDANIPGTQPGTRDMRLFRDTNDVYGSRCTATHEYGHFVANCVFDLSGKLDVTEFENAAASDWAVVSKQEWIKSFNGLCGKYAAEEKFKDQWAQTHFGKNFTKLSFEDRWKLTAEADILGSISIGEYGFGHPPETYVMDFYREAFANMYLARKYHWTDICEKYPNIMKYLEEKIK